MGILFTTHMGILFTITMGILFTIVLGIQFTISTLTEWAFYRRKGTHRQIMLNSLFFF